MAAKKDAAADDAPMDDRCVAAEAVDKDDDDDESCSDSRGH